MLMKKVLGAAFGLIFTAPFSYASDTTPSHHESSSISITTNKNQNDLLIPHLAEKNNLDNSDALFQKFDIFTQLKDLITEVLAEIIDCDTKEIKIYADLISFQLSALNQNNNFYQFAYLCMTDHISKCEGKRALLWLNILQNSGKYINDEIIGQIDFLIRNENY